MDIGLELLMAVELFQAEYACDHLGSSNGRGNGQLLHVFTDCLWPSAFLVSLRVMPPTTTVDAHLSLEIGWLRDVLG
jgi:hypothetical protein